MESQVLVDLYRILESRKQADPSSSYTASLYASGLRKIARKVMEEAYETVEAAQLRELEQGDKDHLIEEIADLWYHTLVLACQQNLQLKEIFQALEKRKGKSGLEEKRSRES